MSSNTIFRRFAILLMIHTWIAVASAQRMVPFTRIMGNFTVDFQSFPIRSPNFAVLIQQSDGSFTPFNPGQSRTYLGTVRGLAGAMASALPMSNGMLLSRISFEDGVELEWLGASNTVSINPVTDWTPQWPSTVVSPSKSDAIVSNAEVGIDASYAYYVASGSDVQKTLDLVEFSILAANIPFFRDASILHKVGKVVIRANQAKDPYSNTDLGVLLNTLKSQWNTEIATVVGNTHHLATVIHSGAGGGIGWIGGVGTSIKYSANGAGPNGDFSFVWRHVAGLNWGSNQYEGGGQPEGPTVMSGNQLSRFSSSELAAILPYKSKVPAANVSYPRPPRANMDALETICQCPHIVDVLANDFDAQVKSLNLIHVQNPTAKGGTVSCYSKKQIIYTPSLAGVLSSDYFNYTIQNVQGKSSTGYVVVRPHSLVAWWKMEDGSGTTALDSSGHGASGSISGSASWDESNGGLSFGGAGMVSVGTKPSLSGKISFTVCSWIRVPSSSTASSAVIIQQRSSSGYDGEYRLSLVDAKPTFMVYGNSQYQFDFSVPATVNDDTWHHIVAVRSMTEGYIYMDGKLMASGNGPVRDLDVNIPVFMGLDQRDNNAFFKGSMMGLRLYNRALTPNEIKYLSTRPEALVGWWKMDESGSGGLTLLDSSGNSATGSIIGSAKFEDGGMAFGGAAHILIGKRASLKGKTSFSIHVWVKIPSIANSGGVIIQQRSPADSSTDGFNGEYVLQIEGTGKPNFYVFGNGNYQFGLSASAAVNDGKWHYVVAIRDGSNGRIYVDGKLSASVNGTIVRDLNPNISLFIGCDGRDNTAFLVGSLKDLKLYNQVVLPLQANILPFTSPSLSLDG